ncbi:MAG TPA: hypothetical protein VF590_13320 [Isosphaeraceae bacterium]|jgi:YVTN family beta-propeller protein
MVPILRVLIVGLLLSPGLSAQTTMVVVQKGDDSLGFYDAESGRPLTRVAVGAKPHELTLAADGKFAYVTLYGIDRYTEDAEGGHAIAVVDLEERKKVGEIDLGRHHRPHGIERGRSGRLYVTCDRPPSLLVIDQSVDAAEVVSPIALTQELPHMVAVTPDERTAYVANSGSGSVSVVSLGLGRETKTIAIGGVPMGLVLSADVRRLHAANRTGNAVAVIDTGTQEVVTRVAIPGNPARVRLTPDGQHLLVSLIEAGDVAVVDTGTLRVVHRFHAGGHTEGLTIDPAGRFGYVSAGDDDTVVRFTLEDWKPVGAIRTARKPDPIVILDRGRAPDDRGAGEQPLPPSTFSPRVAPAPEGWDLDPFYKKHATARGLPVLDSEGVSDFALKEAAYLIDRMLARRPDLLGTLAQDKVRVSRGLEVAARLPIGDVDVDSLGAHNRAVPVVDHLLDLAVDRGDGRAGHRRLRAALGGHRRHHPPLRRGTGRADGAVPSAVLRPADAVPVCSGDAAKPGRGGLLPSSPGRRKASCWLRWPTPGTSWLPIHTSTTTSRRRCALSRRSSR